MLRTTLEQRGFSSPKLLGYFKYQCQIADGNGAKRRKEMTKDTGEEYNAFCLAGLQIADGVDRSALDELSTKISGDLNSISMDETPYTVEMVEAEIEKWKNTCLRMEGIAREVTIVSYFIHSRINESLVLKNQPIRYHRTVFY